MKDYTIEYDTSNSGGSYWLSDADWQALAAAGWRVIWLRDATGRGPRACLENPLAITAFLTVAAPDEWKAREIARDRWEDIVGQDPNSDGCECCGRPHDFFAIDV